MRISYLLDRLTLINVPAAQVLELEKGLWAVLPLPLVSHRISNKNEFIDDA